MKAHRSLFLSAAATLALSSLALADPSPSRGGFGGGKGGSANSSRPSAGGRPNMPQARPAPRPQPQAPKAGTSRAPMPQKSSPSAGHTPATTHAKAGSHSREPQPRPSSANHLPTTTKHPPRHDPRTAPRADERHPGERRGGPTKSPPKTPPAAGNGRPASDDRRVESDPRGKNSSPTDARRPDPREADPRKSDPRKPDAAKVDPRRTYPRHPDPRPKNDDWTHGGNKSDGSKIWRPKDGHHDSEWRHSHFPKPSPDRRGHYEHGYRLVGHARWDRCVWSAPHGCYVFYDALTAAPFFYSTAQRTYLPLAQCPVAAAPVVYPTQPPYCECEVAPVEVVPSSPTNEPPIWFDENDDWGI